MRHAIEDTPLKYLMYKAALILCFLWSEGAVARSYQEKELRKRDLQYLERLKQELAKAEDMPGGLDHARKLKRQIASIEKGTTIYTPDLNQPLKEIAQEQVRQTQAMPDAMPQGHAPNPYKNQDVLSLTEGGRDLDLFHEKTVTVGEDYGISKEAMDSHTRPSQDSHSVESLKIPEDGVLPDPTHAVSSNDSPESGMKAPLYGTPFEATSPYGTASTSESSSGMQAPTIPVDAMHFQRPQSFQRQDQRLYGNPPGEEIAQSGPGGMSPYRGVVPSKTPSLAWNPSKADAGYLEEQLKTKLAQLLGARRRLSSCTGEEADALTSRIYDLETEKRSLLRMMKALGIKPTFTTLSAKESVDFDTMESQDTLLKKQLHEMEKQEKKLRRQMRTEKDPETLTNIGERLAFVERNHKLVEASLKTSQQNTASVDRAAFVDRPVIYAKEPSSKPETTDSGGHPDYEEGVVKQLPPVVRPTEGPLAPLSAQSSSLVPLNPDADPSLEEDFEEEEKKTCLQDKRSGFWTSGLPTHSESHRKTPVERPQRVDRDEATIISSAWDAE